MNTKAAKRGPNEVAARVGGIIQSKMPNCQSSGTEPRLAPARRSCACASSRRSSSADYPNLNPARVSPKTSDPQHQSESARRRRELLVGCG